MKKIATLAVFVFMIINMQAQQNISVFINGKKEAVAASGNAAPVMIKLKKQKAAKLKSLAIEINSSTEVAPVYKRTVTVFDGTVFLQAIDENKEKKGYFTFNDKKLLSLLASGKKLLVQLQLNPADERVMISSKMQDLCYISM